MRILCWAQTDVGQKRDHNEDSFLVAPDLGLYVVADGMGGHAGGDQASQMAVSVLHEAVRRAGLDAAPGGGSVGDEPTALAVLRSGARDAGEMIFDLAQQNAHLAGMGTTLTALLFHGGRVHLAHVGDSRAYLFRDGRIEQLSEDHSWINEQVKAGLLTDEEARHSKFKHIITRSVGFERDVSVDVMSLPVLMGDCYLVCSDGLSNYLESDELGRLLTASYYARVPRLLVDLANERGGDDNITVLLVYVANDSGPPLVEDLSRPDPAQASTLPGEDPELAAVRQAEQAAERMRARAARAAPGTPVAPLPPEGKASVVPASGATAPASDTPSAAPSPSAAAVPLEAVDPLADTAPAATPPVAIGGAAANATVNGKPAARPSGEDATPVSRTEEPTPEAGQPAAPRDSKPT